MVKYADGPTTEVQQDIAAGVEVVWPLLCDINLPADYSDEFQRAEWIDDGPALGATFRGYNRHERVGEWDLVCTITDYVEQQVFEWSTGEPERAARWRFDLTGTESGSRLRFSAEMGPGPSGLTPAIERMPDREEEIVARRLSEWTSNMERTVSGIRDRAEQSS
ncbi:MAG: SRPBCC family protein [Actinomycetota bacterium]